MIFLGGSKTYRNKGFFLFLLILLGMPFSAKAQEIAVPVKLQVELFVKILSFERTYLAAAPPKTKIAVVYQHNYRSSFEAWSEIQTTLETRQQIELLPINIDEGSLETLLQSHQPHLVVVCPLRSYTLGQITAYSRKEHILTASLVSRYTKEGISIGIEVERNHPIIVINQQAAQMEHADFDSRFLKLVRFLKP